MKKVPKIPQIRVKGFTQEWTEHLLNYYLETSQEKNFDGLYQKEDVLSVSGDCGIVNQIEFQGRSFAGASVLNYGVVHTGDVVYTKSPLKENPYGIIKTNTGKAGIVSTLYAVYHPKEVTYSEFVQWYFENNDRLNHYLNPLVNKGAKNDMKVSSDNALLGTVIFPDSAEQKAVSDSLTHIKNIILQCEFRLEKLQALKASMLEKMFPKDGADVPEVRFKEFTGVWEQRKLGDMGTTYTGLSNKTKDDFGHGSANFVTYMNVFTNPITDSKEVELVEVEENQNRVQKGDAFFTTSSETPDEVGMSSVLLESLDNTYLNSFCFGYRPIQSIDSVYLAYMLRSKSVRKKITFLAQGISRYNISKTKVMEIAVPIPKHDEQVMVGRFFRAMDHLITIQQQELDKLQSIKKALLEKMFV